ncbi:MAG: WbqC family protein [Chitinophagaceae bacterium]|nr:WbqC family protein [Chitinophagaceae bacterium]
MGKTVVIHQPDFLPYLGFFHRFLHADEWIVLDHVQFLSGSKSWHNRDRIKTENGPVWLTVAVKKCPRATPIKEVELSDQVDWRRGNLNLIRHNYRLAPFFGEIFPIMEELYQSNALLLSEFNLAGINLLAKLFDVEIPQVFSSAMNPQGASTSLLMSLVKNSDASIYLSGVGAKNYFDESVFCEAGIEVKWQNFVHPVYPQLYGDFVPYLSCIDLLFNCGIFASRSILKSL